MDDSEQCEMTEDIVLQVNGTKFKCQKERLIDASDYFKGMFASNMKESSSDLIELKEVKTEVIEILISSLTYEPDVTEDNVYEVLEASVIYQFKDMLKLCCEFLDQHLCHSNCLYIMCMADMFSLSDLYSKAKTHALWYFEDVSRETEVYELSELQFIEYLSNSMLNCSDEWIVFELVCSWFKQNISDSEFSMQIDEDNNCTVTMDTSSPRAPSDLVIQYNANNNPKDSSHATRFCRLLEKCVYLDMMCEQQLENLTKYPLIKDNDGAKMLVMKAAEKRKSSLGVRNNVKFIQRRHPSSIVCFGGHLCSSLPCPNPDECEGTEVSRDLLLFSPDGCTFHVEKQASDSNSEWGENALRMLGCQVTLVDKEVFVTGGEAVLGRNTWQYAVTIFNCITRKWSCGKDLRQPRRHHGACAVDGRKLFLIGGFGRLRKILNSVESYDVEAGKWVDHPPMLQPEFSAAVTVCNSSIYVFKTQIQRYDLDTKVWSFIKLAKPISSAVTFALTLDTSIYLCCKYNKTLSVMESKTHKYQEVGLFQTECKGCSVVNGKIYWFENVEQGFNRPSPMVECFDPRDKAFTCVGKVSNCFLAGNIVTIPKYPTFHPSVLA